MTMPMPPPPAAPRPNLQAELIERAAWKRGMLGGLNAVMLVVAARMIVMIAVLGGIFLTWLALQNPDPYRLGALGIYTFGVLGSTVWLAGR